MRQITKWLSRGLLVTALFLPAVPALQGQSQTIKGRNPLSEAALGRTVWIEEFDLSPDGSQVVFRSAQGGNYNLWVVPLAGGEPKALTSHPIGSRARNPQWSPDGQWIAYEVDWHLPYQSETYDVFVIPAAGGEPRNLTSSSWSTESGIVWTPDSRNLIFTASSRQPNAMTPLAGGGILRVEVMTGQITQVSPRGGGDLQLSPDGRFIVYSSNRVRTPTFYMDGDLYMIPAEGGEERMLTPNSVGYREQDPAWSPDGKSIAFVTGRSGYDNVVVMDVQYG